jgi:lipoprotein NlpD
VEERSVSTQRQEIQRYGGHLVRFVKPGDTLYGIAFESNLSVRKLAAWNDIEDYRGLRVGQRLRLTKPYGFVEKRRSVVSSKPVVVTRVPKPTVSSKKPSSRAATPKVKAPMPVNKKNKPVKKSSKKWVWPVNGGSVLRTFSPKHGRQGIDISVVSDSPVVASRAGEVVYVGSSLKGYGKLIIIKHDGEFLSAYAHNKKIQVKEGQLVKIQERIGTSGLNNRGEPALQFQIRIDGNSVNPLPYVKG